MSILLYTADQKLDLRKIFPQHIVWKIEFRRICCNSTYIREPLFLGDLQSTEHMKILRDASHFCTFWQKFPALPQVFFCRLRLIFQQDPFFVNSILHQILCHSIRFGIRFIFPLTARYNTDCLRILIQI